MIGLVGPQWDLFMGGRMVDWQIGVEGLKVGYRQMLEISFSQLAFSLSLK